MIRIRYFIEDGLRCNKPRSLGGAAAADQISVQGVDHRTTEARVVRQVPEDPPDEVADARTPAGTERACDDAELVDDGDVVHTQSGRGRPLGRRATASCGTTLEGRSRAHQASRPPPGTAREQWRSSLAARLRRAPAERNRAALGTGRRYVRQHRPSWRRPGRAARGSGRVAG
jgi:hypothetical protein